MTVASEIVFGSDKTLEECDWIYLQLTPAMREQDRYLQGQCWFDYRFSHPVHLTYLFADAYRTAYREAFKREVDFERAEHVKGFKGEDVFDFASKRANDLAGFIKARQWADAMTMPYLEFTRIAFSWAMRSKRKHLPRPCHLYNFNLLTAIQETWRERQGAKVYVSTLEPYRNANYCAAPAQDAHHEWLLQQASFRANAKPFLHRVLYEDDVLIESKVVARYGRDMLDEVRAFN